MNLFELRDEILQFFRQKNHDFQADLESKESVTRLACLMDIFEVLNNFNLLFQGPNQTATLQQSSFSSWKHLSVSSTSG